MQVNIYTMTDIRGPRKRDGYGLFVIETETAAGPATLTKGILLEDHAENGANLTVLLEAVRRITKQGEIVIFTPSEWLRSGLVSWLPAWKENGYRNSRGEPVANAEAWQELGDLLEADTVTVSTETGHPYGNWMLAELKKRKEGKGYVREIWQHEQRGRDQR